MRNRDIYFPFVSTAVLFAMLAFLSCAHKARVQADSETTPESSVAENSAEQPAGEATADNANANNDDLSKLAENGSAEPTPEQTAQAAEQTPESSQIDNMSASTSAEPTTDPQAIATNPQDSLATNDLGSLDTATTEITPESPAATTPTETPQAATETPAPLPVAEAPKEWKKSLIPTVPTTAVQKKGSNLNRFYFARSGDTAESVSELLYGNADKARDLKKWNPSKLAFKPGRIVYYQSSQNPTDNEMRSFYQENSVQSEDYIVKKGDWLSKISHNKYGSPDSWKEIAVINGMDSPDSLNVGQRIALYPTNLKSNLGTQQPPVAENKIEPKQDLAMNAPAPEVNTPAANTQNSLPPANSLDAPAQLPQGQAPTFGEKEKPTPKAKKSLEGLDIAKLVEQNLFAVAMGGLILLLMIALMAVNKRKKSKSEDFGDDVLPISASRKR
jgi:hypothetical protein